MTKTTRRTLQHKTSRHPTARTQGKKKNGIVKLVQKRKSQGRHVLQNYRKSVCHIKTGQSQVPGHRVRSSRVLDRGYYKRFLKKNDGLECVIEFCGKENSHGDEYSTDDGDVANGTDARDDDDEDDGDEDDDDEEDDDASTWKYTHTRHDGDWVPKSYAKNWMRHDGDNHESLNSVVSGKRARSAVNCGGHYHSYDTEDDDSDKNSDHDSVVPSKRACDVDHTPGKIVDNCYHHNDDDDRDFDATHSHGYHDSADESMIHIDEDYPQTDTVAYVRRRRSVNSLLKSCNTRAKLAGEGSKCSTSLSHLARLISLWSNKADFPSWKNKKPRVVCKKQGKAGKAFTFAAANQLENRCDVQVHCKLNTAGQQMQQHADCDNVCISPTWQRKSPHMTAMSLLRQGEPALPTHPNSPAVFLSTVLDSLPKEFAESELTSSLHGDDASNNQPLSLSQHTQEEMAEDRTGKEKSQAPMGKPKRKKHRPKVQRDISRKAKSTPRKKKAPAQQGDGLQIENQRVRKKRQAKKGHDECDSTMESSTTSKKQCGRKQGRRASPANASTALKDNNLGTECSYTFNGESSIIPLQSTILQGADDQDSQNSSSQNLTVREVACLHELLASKAELSMYTHMANFTPELVDSMQGNKPALYGHFLGQQVPCFIYESKLALLLKSMEELIISPNNLSLVHSKSDSSIQPLLTQEPHNQLEMVVYNQRREMVVSKSTKSRVKIRAKVQLDAENERMWPLLVLGGIPTDFEDVIYWERERAIMENNVSLFIHNMQAVQGDRHFSPWKGSILDSVVGAFLTQNVSDHLSSSAFMSVAARYPSKWRNNREDTNSSDETLYRENESALEVSRISYETQSDTQDIYTNSSSSIVEESSRQQENKNVPNIDGSGKITSSCETIECTEQIRPCSSLRGVKSVLRNNGASQPIEIRDRYNKSDLLTPSGTSTAFTDEDSAKQCGMQPLDGTFKEKILLEGIDNSSSNLNHTDSKPVNYTEQKSMHHLDRASPHFMEGILLIESSDIVASVSNDNNITVDYTGQSASEHAPFHLPTEENDTTQKPRLSPIVITADYIGQGGMQNLEKASSWLDTSTKSCSNSILDLGHHKGTSANHIGQSGTRHLSQSSMEEDIANEPSDISTSSLSPNHYTGQVGLQHLDRAFHCSMEDDISMNQNDLLSKSIIVKQDLCNHDDSGAECFDKEKLCSLLCTEVSCDHESVRSASKTRGLVDSSNTNTLLQEVGPSIAESPTFEQCTTDRSWPSPDIRTEVYSKTTVCRSLFQNYVSIQINSNTTTLISSNNNEQASMNFDTSHTKNHLAVIQESKQMACGSEIVHNVVASSPVSMSLGNKKRHHALSGIERAHLEENQHGRKKNHTQDWELMRRQALQSCISNKTTCKENSRKDAYQDSVDWDAVRRAPVEELAETIKERGMHHVLSGRIKAFLKTLHEEQGNLDLEWLRKVSPEDAKAYLTNIRGLGVKSVECIRLLTLHHVSFPVDVNVGRICVRLGWVPIEPLPEQLQLHLLELYPVQETIQKFLWPRLCMLDQKTLYELHYQLITFGKVFCTKSKPNCNACPMRTNCKHFASAYASAKLLLTGPDNNPSKRLCSGTPIPALTNSPMDMEGKPMVEIVEGGLASQALEKDFNSTYLSECQQYFVEEPASPEETHEPEIEEEIGDIEDFPYIYGSLNDFTEDLLRVSELSCESMDGYSNYTHKEVNKKWEQDNKLVHAGIEASCMTTSSCSNTIEGPFSADCTLTATRASCSSYKLNDPSYRIFSSYETVAEEAASDISAGVNEGATNALVSLPEGAYIPAPKLKNIDRLRTVHYVYELPDDHPLLEHADVRETDDPSFYLLAIWSPGEAPDSLSGIDEDHQDELCRFSGSTNVNETVSGTLLIPCRTAIRGSFPLNGTYFQVNEVFADHDSSLRPFQIPRSHIWRLQRRFVYFGTSVSNIFRGLTLDEIKSCFLRGYVCVRGFDRKYQTPRPLVCRLHFPISKQIQRYKKDGTEASYKK